MTETDDIIDFEGDIARRMDALIARKRADNESTIARITTLDTAWQDVNGEIDGDLKAGLDTVRVETQAIEDARQRLERNVCAGIDPNAFGIAGKLVDAKTRVGLPGLTVRVTLGLEGAAAAQNAEAVTDNFGDFFFSFPIDPALIAKVKQLSLLIVVLFDANTVVYREQRALEPKAGAIEHLTVPIDCSGKLKDVLEQGRQVAASVEGDAKLVEARAANFDAAYATFQSLSETTLAQLRALKADLSGPAPTPGAATVVTTTAASVTPTRFLGNSHDREVHDLENQKKQCRIEAIKPDHRVYFDTERDAVAAGYDYCSYCFGKQKSKR